MILPRGNKKKGRKKAKGIARCDVIRVKWKEIEGRREKVEVRNEVKHYSKKHSSMSTLVNEVHKIID